MSKKNKNDWQVAYWTLFLGLSLVLGMKMLEVSAEKRLEIIILSSGLSQSSSIRN